LIPLTTNPELEVHPSLSPDGSSVAFSWKGDIHVKQIGGEGVMQITKTSDYEGWPTWSPDGREIAFNRQGTVFIIPALGGGERQITRALGRPVWTPDGSGLIVTQRANAYATSIFLVAMSTGEKKQLTFPGFIVGDSAPALSPDGLTLAFVRIFKSDDIGDIFTVPLSGGNVTRLTKDNQVIHGLAWTADGREIVFSSERRGVARLWRTAAAPRNPAIEPASVIEAGDDARFPSISHARRGVPSRLVYQQYTRDFDIRRAEFVPSERGREETLNPSNQFIQSTRQEYSPVFSPDSTKIAFISDRSGPTELWICDADGLNPLKLTSFDGRRAMLPQWSPDGQQILFSAITGINGTFESYAIRRAGGALKRLSPANDPEFWSHPIGSRDGRWIYFAATLSGSLQLWKMPSAGGTPMQITKNSGYRPLESPDGRNLYYGKHDKPEVWRIPVDGGEETRVLQSVVGRNWTVAPKGIYYFEFPGAPGAPKPVKLYSFQTGTVRNLGTVEPTVTPDFSGISVSSDGRWLLYSHISSTTSDLMVLDGFR
jgi:Tol biopolymer transport system component